MRPSRSLLAVGLFLLASGCGRAGPTGPTGGLARTEEEPGGEPRVRTGLGAEWIARGEAAYREGNVERAKGAFERALRLAPDDERARRGMALVEAARLEFAAASRRTRGLSGDGAAIHLQTAWLAGDLAAARVAARTMRPTKGLNKLIADLCDGSDRRPYRRGEGARRGTMPLVTDASLPVVVVGIDGRPARLLVDTGAVETILDRAFVGGEAETKWIGEMALGSFVLHDVPAFVRDISSLAASLRTDLDGILGLDVLRHTYATLDYPEGWLLVRSDGSDAAPDATEVPFHLFRGRYLSILVRVEDLDPLPFLVASGGTFAVSLTDAALRRTGRDPAALRREADGLARYALRSLALGSTSVTGVPAVHGVFPQAAADDAGVEFAGVISQQLLAGFRVTMDPERRVLALEAAPEPEP